MIQTVADLLNKIREKEVENIKKYEIVNHGPMIGDMYEGLTKDILTKSIFKDINLKVVSGKIRSSKNELSKQIDCMIVEGDGDKLPYSDNYIYNVEQVIAVIEVKKNLFSKELESSYKNLLSVKKIAKPKTFKLKMVRDPFRGIVKKELPEHEQIKELPINEQYIYYSLVSEAFLPVRIAFGYNGFKSEYNFRKAFYSYLNKNLSNNMDKLKFGYGPTSLPNLIICGEYSIIKLNGMPYGTKLGKDDFWPIMASYSNTPILLLLELLWTRLSYTDKISSKIFGEDLKAEVLKKLLSCKIAKKNDKLGWEYKYHDISSQRLRKMGTTFEWEPVFINNIQHFAFRKLCNEGYINLNDTKFINIIEKHDYDFDDFINELVGTDLIYVDDNHNIRLLTDNCEVVALPDGRVVAAENKSGRLTNWVLRYASQE